MVGPSASLAAVTSPRPRATPKEKLRDCIEEQVKTRSPKPESPIRVRGSAPRDLPKRNISLKARVVRAARELSPKDRPSLMPQAIASTFLTAPPSWTPKRSAEE